MPIENQLSFCLANTKSGIKDNNKSSIRFTSKDLFTLHNHGSLYIICNK